MNKTLEDMLNRVSKKVLNHGEENFVDQFVGNVLLLVNGLTPREHAELITELGGKAKDTESIDTLCKKSKTLTLKALKVKAFKGGSYSALLDSPIVHLKPTVEEETTMPKKKVNTKKKVAAKKTAAAPEQKAKGRKSMELRYCQEKRSGNAIWEALPSGINTKLKIGTLDPKEGSHTYNAVQALATFGRKKPTGQAVVDKMIEDGYRKTDANNHVTYCVNVGFIDVV